jgi:hypothetical protein
MGSSYDILLSVACDLTCSPHRKFNAIEGTMSIFVVFLGFDTCPFRWAVHYQLSVGRGACHMATTVCESVVCIASVGHSIGALSDGKLD